MIFILSRLWLLMDNRTFLPNSASERSDHDVKVARVGLIIALSPVWLNCV